MAKDLRTCSMQGCGQKHLAKGLCKLHYNRGKPRPTYHAWRDMHRRCSDPSSASYSNYGARGIQVCKRWNTYANFLADMGERPAGKSLDRRNNDKNYSPKNCRWATRDEQIENRRRTTRITYDGQTLSIAAWSRKTGLSVATIRDRYDRKMPAARILAKGSLRPPVRTVTLNGQTRTISEWAQIIGANPQGMRWRARQGYADDVIIYGIGHKLPKIVRERHGR